MKLAYAVASPETADADMLALRRDPAEAFRLLARLGYRGIDLMVRDPAQIDSARLRDLAAANGLAFASVSTGQIRKEDRLSLTAPDERERVRAVDRGKATIDLAAALGAHVNIGTFRGTLGAGPARETALGVARAGLVALVDHARDRSVAIAIEPQSRYVIDWLNNVGETLAFIDTFPRDGRPGVLLDVYHAALEEPSLPAALVRAAPRLLLVQVSDSNRLPPGAGQLAFGDIVRVLAALGYRGYLSVEALQRPTAAEAAAAAARHLLPYLEET